MLAVLLPELEAASGAPAPGYRYLHAKRACGCTTLGLICLEPESVPVEGTEVNDHPSKRHDLPILAGACSGFDVGDGCDLGAISVRLLDSAAAEH